MSVIMEFAIFPTDKGAHVSQYVKKVVDMIDALPYKSELTPMGTIVECDTMNECLHIISKANTILEEDAERIISRIESARDKVIGKVEQMGTEVRRRLDAAKQEALHQADEARKIAATAAWWAFASAVVSGVAAVLGGIVAAMSMWRG